MGLGAPAGIPAPADLMPNSTFPIIFGGDFFVICVT